MLTFICYLLPAVHSLGVSVECHKVLIASAFYAYDFSLAVLRKVIARCNAAEAYSVLPQYVASLVQGLGLEGSTLIQWVSCTVDDAPVCGVASWRVVSGTVVFGVDSSFLRANFLALTWVSYTCVPVLGNSHSQVGIVSFEG